MSSSAARTNLTSNSVRIHTHQVLGEGAFRTAYAGTYVGGNRNNQEAVCKCFKNYYRELEDEFFRSDFQVADKAIQYAEEWNQFCDNDEIILITRGSVHNIGHTKYMVSKSALRSGPFNSLCEKI